MILVNFGSGPYPLDGWINVDLDPAGRPEVLADLGRPLPFADACADAIFSEDFVAQLEPDALRRFLAECRRMLKPAGTLRVLTPDLARFILGFLLGVFSVGGAILVSDVVHAARTGEDRS